MLVLELIRRTCWILRLGFGGDFCYDPATGWDGNLGGYLSYSISGDTIFQAIRQNSVPRNWLRRQLNVEDSNSNLGIRHWAWFCSCLSSLVLRQQFSSVASVLVSPCERPTWLLLEPTGVQAVERIGVCTGECLVELLDGSLISGDDSRLLERWVGNLLRGTIGFWRCHKERGKSGGIGRWAAKQKLDKIKHWILKKYNN